MRLRRLALCAASALSVSFCGAPAFAHREAGPMSGPGQCPPTKGRAAMKITDVTPTASSRKAMMKVGVAE